MKKILISVAVITVLVFGLAGSVNAQGMMGSGFGGGMMGPGFGGMMGAFWDYIPPGDVKPLTIEQAAEKVERYLTDRGNPDLKLTEVMEFTNHFYAEVEEESTNIHAFELIINRYTGDIFPEPGPNMMWNIKYSHMGGGMMGWGMMGSRSWGSWYGYKRRRSSEEMPVSPDKAKKLSQKFLDYYLPGTKVEDETDRFYGYYTIHVEKDEKTYGMLSVNGFTGQVWYHTWHGNFLGMSEEEE